MRDVPCRCCGVAPKTGWFGLCSGCSKAVERLIILRRFNLKARGRA